MSGSDISQADSEEDLSLDASELVQMATDRNDSAELVQSLAFMAQLTKMGTFLDHADVHAAMGRGENRDQALGIVVDPYAETRRTVVFEETVTRPDNETLDRLKGAGIGESDIA